MKQTNIVIVYLGDFFFDARCINMTLSLLKENLNISIICPYANHLQYSEFKDVKFYNIQINNNGILKYWEFHNKVIKILNKEKFDIIISGDLYSLSSGCLSKNKIKMIYDCREIYTELSAHYYNPIYKLFWNIYERYFLKFVDTVIVTAYSDLTYLKEKYKTKEHLKWYVIFNYPIEHTNTNKINLRKKYNIHSDKHLILYQGVIQKKRGIHQLLRVIKNTNNLIGIIIGSGDTEYYKKQAIKLNIINKIIFFKKINYLELLDYTSSCDIGWAVIQDFGLSNQNALPNKLFEYALMGLPVIASKLPNMEKTIIENNLGILVDVNNTSEHIKAINILIKNYSQYSNPKKIKNKFTWNCQHKKFIDLIYE